MLLILKGLPKVTMKNIEIKYNPPSPDKAIELLELLDKYFQDIVSECDVSEFFEKKNSPIVDEMILIDKELVKKLKEFKLAFYD